MRGTAADTGMPPPCTDKKVVMQDRYMGSYRYRLMTQRLPADTLSRLVAMASNWSGGEGIHSHTYTHIYIYTYMYIHIYVYI
jgi:hypothetical protein